jgi:hypothetical protein
LSPLFFFKTRLISDVINMLAGKKSSDLLNLERVALLILSPFKSSLKKRGSQWG